MGGTAARRAPLSLQILAIPMVVLLIVSMIGDALAPQLVDQHPLALVLLNARNRNLVLVTNQLDALSYYGVATVRLLLSDPVYFLLGYWYGDTALKWMEGRTTHLGRLLRHGEHWFRRASYVFVFVAPNPFFCLCAGAMGMRVGRFFAVNLAGTLARLFLIRRVGEAFADPIDDLLELIRDYRAPLLALSICIVALMAARQLRSKDGELEVLLNLEEEFAELEAEVAADLEAGPDASAGGTMFDMIASPPPDRSSPPVADAPEPAS